MAMLRTITKDECKNVPTYIHSPCVHTWQKSVLQHLHPSRNLWFTWKNDKYLSKIAIIKKKTLEISNTSHKRVCKSPEPPTLQHDSRHALGQDTRWQTPRDFVLPLSPGPAVIALQLSRLWTHPNAHTSETPYDLMTIKMAEENSPTWNKTTAIILESSGDVMNRINQEICK